MKLTPELTESLTLKFSQTARKLIQEGKQIYSLGLGEPDFETPLEIKESAIRAINDGYTRYSNSKGLLELRNLIASKLQKENQIESTPENIVVTPGAKNALMLTLMAILRPEDSIINLNPCYVSYIPQIKIAEPKSNIINVDLSKENFELDWDLLYKKTENSRNIKAMIINFPNNPTGVVLKSEDFEKLGTFIQEKNCYLISDEIYEKLSYKKNEHLSPGSIEAIKDRVITINGFSKAFSMTGWRIGYLNANKDIIQTVTKLQQHINTNTATFIQKAACEAFKLKTDYLSQYLKQLNERAQYMEIKINKLKRVKVIPPEGGLFGFVNIKNLGIPSDNFCTELLNSKGVATTPGIAFGKSWDDHVRISLAITDDIFFKGIDLFCEYCKSLE